MDVLCAQYPVPEFDGVIGFCEEPRHYFNTLTGEKYLASVSEVVGGHFASFDADAVIAGMFERANRARFPRPLKAEYVGKTPKQIKAMWEALRDDASSRGTRMHAAFERFMKEGHFDDADGGAAFAARERANVPEIDRFLAFLNSVVRPAGLRPFRAELRMADAKAHVGGCSDLLLIDPADQRLVLCDYKRSKLVQYDGFGANDTTLCDSASKSPLFGMANTNGSKYWLQQHAYRRILERNAPSLAARGHLIKEIYLVIFSPVVNAAPWELQAISDFATADVMIDWVLADFACHVCTHARDYHHAVQKNNDDE